MKPWLSPSQWARAWDVLYWPDAEDRDERLVHFFGVMMSQVLDAVREMAPPELLQKLARFSLDTGKPSKEPLALRLEKFAQPLFDSTPIQANVPALKFFQAPKAKRGGGHRKKTERMAGYLRSRIGKRRKP